MPARRLTNNASYLELLLKNYRQETAELKNQLAELDAEEVQRDQKCRDAYKKGRACIEALQKSLLLQESTANKHIEELACLPDEVRSRASGEQDAWTVYAIEKTSTILSNARDDDRKNIEDLLVLKRTTFQELEHHHLVHAHHVEMRKDMTAKQMVLLGDIMKAIEGAYNDRMVDLIVEKRVEEKDDKVIKLSLVAIACVVAFVMVFVGYRLV